MFKQLSKKNLSNFQVYCHLEYAYVKKISAVQSKIIGQLNKVKEWPSENDWISAQPIPIPFFDNQPFPVRFEKTLSTPDYFEKAEEAIQYFFNYTADVKTEAAQKAYDCWINFNEACSYMDNLALFEEVENPPDWILNNIKNLRHLSQLTSADKVWAYITPVELVITKDRFNVDKEIYIQALCRCVWDDEHGIQFVFKEGRELTRVSEQDGDLFN
jgi:hypothetical protein